MSLFGHVTGHRLGKLLGPQLGKLLGFTFGDKPPAALDAVTWSHAWLYLW